ncbi:MULTISPECIES: DUF2313 domain-containing protein [unclassified Dehalobacter]|uniref:DUF2313 domain-containing protein n=1 Tax=unclassified Dehalobacter TaxID=2635733 RepID=UPI001044D2FA|nr:MULTISPECIES: DUF2313 domain-containing protein [unclassified Dehalobacter]TCX51918.1 hypothetical protein C1I36_06265 [Dehalobacter sp. 14DCB1]TCX52978.1 hypothetical protein C1I38_07945 [Dehalobacter sp. 12DCB1]
MLAKFDELKTYLPEFYQQLQEAAAYLAALGVQMDGVHEDTMQARDNNFVFLAGADAVTRLEKFMQIPFDPARTLEDRKRLIASFFVGNNRIGATEIKELIKVFTPSPTDVTFAASTINVRVTRDIEDTFILGDFYFILLKKIPAHLDLVITVLSTFETSFYVGGAMTQYKEEVIDA